MNYRKLLNDASGLPEYDVAWPGILFLTFRVNRVVSSCKFIKDQEQLNHVIIEYVTTTLYRNVGDEIPNEAVSQHRRTVSSLPTSVSSTPSGQLSCLTVGRTGVVTSARILATRAEDYCCFFQLFHVNAEPVLQTTLRPLPFTHFPINYLVILLTTLHVAILSVTQRHQLTMHATHV